MNKLTEAQTAILRDLTNGKRYADGWACAQWVAESCGHAYETAWVSSKLPGLIKRGLIERGAKGWYRLTPAGLTALADPSPQDRPTPSNPDDLRRGESNTCSALDKINREAPSPTRQRMGPP